MRTESLMALLTRAFATCMAVILFGVSLLAVVDGLEWAFLSLAGVGRVPTEILIGLTSLPLVYLLARLGREIWRTERALEIEMEEPDA